MRIIRFVFFALFLSLIPISAMGTNGWTSIGPFGGSVGDVAVHPLDPSLVYAIGYMGGVFKSVDAGASWHDVNTGLPRHQALAIALDPLDVNVVYVGLYRNGVFKTRDGGASWVRYSNGLPEGTIQTIVADPGNSSVLFTGYREGWIYRTTDSGSSWSLVFSGSIRLNALRIAPSDSSIVVASRSDGLFRSTDGGTSWLQVPGATGIIGSFAIDPRDSNRILAASYGVQLTTDGGSTWQVTYAQSVSDIKIHPAKPDLVVTNRAISTDGGLTWTETSPVEPCLPQQVSLDPLHPAIVFASSGFFEFIGKGICKSSDSGLTWSQSYNGLNNTVVFHYSVTRDPFGSFSSRRIFVHAGREAGLFYTTNAGVTWKDTGIAGGIYGAAILAPPSTSNLAYAGGSHGNQDSSLWRSTDGGATFSSISNDVAAYWTLTPDPFDAQTMYCSTYDGVSKSVDGGYHWIATEGINSSAYDVVAAPDVPGLLYAGTAGDGVMKSTDGGMNWYPSNNGLMDLQVEKLTLDTHNTRTLYATTPIGLFRTTNGGSNWELRSKKYIYPVVSPSDSMLLYGGSIVEGAFVSRDAGRTWRPFGLQGYSVTFLAFDPFDPTILYAGTSGNGLYRIRLGPSNTKRPSP